jgi:ribonucleoside-triphosphate reductase
VVKIICKITQVRKRDGSIALFNQDKIGKAIFNAAKAVGGKDREKANELSEKVVELLDERGFSDENIPSVEDVQDGVEKVLVEEGHAKTAKGYILYREQHKRMRDLKNFINSNDIMDGYLNHLDWRIKENSNMAFSLQGLNNHISSMVSSNYWLHKIYPPEVRKAHMHGDLHIHDLQLVAAYCCGWDLQDLLTRGFGGVPGKIESKPPKHFRAALGQITNFLYTTQGETAGAQAFSSFDSYLAPYLHYDKLSYKEIKQAMQEFLFNMNVPTRVGFQCPFTNLTMDLKIPSILRHQPIVMGGKMQQDTYGDFQAEADLINKAFAEVMLEGDAKGRLFTFPIPTYNVTNDLDWDNPLYDNIWEMTAKYGIPYFGNFINSDMKPDDVRSMCCRLRLDNRELRKKGGGLFGANPLTGSTGVVTLNMPRIAYLSRDKGEFIDQLTKQMDIARLSLEIKKRAVERFTEAGLYPYSRNYLKDVKTATGSYWGNHFNTIGLIGMNEACLNLLGANIADKEGKRFALEILDVMRERMSDYQEKSSTNSNYNLEATPGEGTGYRLARIDRQNYPDIITAGDREPYYTNSTHLPVNYTDDIFEALELQDKLQCKYTGGTVLHGFLGESINDIETVRQVVKRIASNFKLPYFTLTPTFSVCKDHGYLRGKVESCPTCEVSTEVYSRVVGYLRPISSWNNGKAEEFKDRKEYAVSKSLNSQYARKAPGLMKYDEE